MSESTLTEHIDFSIELNDVIEDYFSRSIQHATAVSPYYGQLWQEMFRLVSSGGKRLRPKMTILAYQAFGGKDVQSILPVAAAQELLHVSMLIHDDIIDRDYSRYGVDNVAGSYNKHYEPFVSDKTDRLHYAHSAALLSGDLLISGAYQLTNESTIEPSMITAVQRLLTNSIFEVVGGELIDTESTFRERGAIKAETVALYKTASYSFVGPLLIGAVMANASEKDQACVRAFAESLGVAFQLRDDVLGVFGDEAEMGKSTTGDIREGKCPYLVEQVYALADDEDRAMFDKYFGDHAITSDEIDIIKNLFVSTGAKEKTEAEISRLEKEALKALEDLSIATEYKEQFRDLVARATRRTK